MDQPDNILRDEQFFQLKSQIGLKRSRGRPSNEERSLLTLTINNKLLLQLNLIRTDTGCTWDVLQTLFDEICRNTKRDLLSHDVRFLIQTCLYQYNRSEKDSTFFDKLVELEFIGSFSRKHSLSKNLLLAISAGECPVIQQMEFIPNGLLLELNIFRNRKGFPVRTLLLWLQTLCSKFHALDTTRLNKLVNKKYLAMQTLRKKTYNPDRPQLLDKFLEASSLSEEVHGSNESASVSFIQQNKLPAVSSISPAMPVQCHSSTTSTLPPTSAASNVQSVSAEVSALSLQFQFEITKGELQALREALTTEKERCASLNCAVQCLQEEKTALTSQLKSSKAQEACLRSSLIQSQKLYSRLKQENVHRRLERLQKKYLQNTLELQCLPSMLEEERKEKRRLQKHASKLSAQNKKLLEDLRLAEDVIKALFDEQQPVVVPETRTSRGYYKDFVLKCIYGLVGECEVPAKRCRDVIKMVSRHFFGVDFHNDQLPCKTTNLRFADQSHSLAKMQVAEAMASQHFDLHIDGTSKNHKKYIGMQVTLEDKQTLSLGFDPVAKETAQNVLQLALDKFQLISLLNSPTDADAEKIKILENLVGLMTDRANTMKCVQHLMADHKALHLPDTAVRLQLYLHCNAHFLLGMSSAAEKALLRVSKENELDGKLGRENLPVFNNFNNRSTVDAVSRYVWMACDTLGPRGDEKNGCHGDWSAFCTSMKKTSQLSSFRANRFNNLFDAAAGLVYHREDILNFSQLREPSNLKQKSVLADATCPLLNTLLCGLAIMSVYITGPFWNLIRSNIHYLDQYTFIQPMYSALQELTQQPDLLLNGGCHTLEMLQLGNKAVPEYVQQAARKLQIEHQHLLGMTLKALAEEFVTVTERQLADFLPGGKYSSVPSEEERQRMAHCQLTNLFGEACFADLDYSMFKSRHGSLHHHSTLNMIKRNSTVSKWLERKSTSEQAKLMQRAKHLGPQMRKDNSKQELIVLQELHDAMEQKRHEGDEKQRKRQEKLQSKKEAILEAVDKFGGPCKSAKELVSLLSKCSSKKEKFQAIKALVDREKVVLSKSAPELRTSNVPLDALCLKFLHFKFGEVDADILNSLKKVCATTSTRGRKRKRVNDCSDSTESDTESLSEIENTDSEVPVQHLESADFTFTFSHQGQTVAVFYDSHFYIGQVLLVHSKDAADIQFMTSTNSGKDNIFRWPEADDIDTVAAKYVFDSDFEVLPRNRIWQVEKERWGVLLARWDAYQKLFC